MGQINPFKIKNMKRFNELTELEIKDLTYDELDKYVLIECAEKGIQIVDRPKSPVYEKELEKDLITYSIGGGVSIYIKFTSKDEADRLAELLNGFESIVDMSNKRIYFSEPSYSFSKERERENDKITKQNNAIKSEYNLLRQEYDQFVEKKEVEQEAIYEKYNSIVRKYDRLDMIKRKYNETYLPLSDNNEEIAKRFLEDAFAITSEDKEYIF